MVNFKKIVLMGCIVVGGISLSACSNMPGEVMAPGEDVSYLTEGGMAPQPAAMYQHRVHQNVHHDQSTAVKHKKKKHMKKKKHAETTDTSNGESTTTTETQETTTTTTSEDQTQSQ